MSNPENFRHGWRPHAANVEPVTAETALKLGRAAAATFSKILNLIPAGMAAIQDRHRQGYAALGYMLENAISSGILSMGVDVLFIGPLPTRALPT